MNEIQDYSKVLQAIKHEIKAGQHRAVLAINKELIFLYWSIGRIILSHPQKEGGSKVINRLARDISSEFPELKGFQQEI